jgi:colanic acid biosynthesis protein WcaH
MDFPSRRTATVMSGAARPTGMEVHDEFLPEARYAAFLETMPQACVDLVVERDGRVLLARRENEPAAGELFWPGSRLYKGEELTAAVDRIAEEELGIAVDVAEQLGANAHLWEVSEESDDVSRHTVVVVYRVTPVDDDPDLRADDQHSAFRWVETPPADANEYVRRYFERWDLPGGG